MYRSKRHSKVAYISSGVGGSHESELVLVMSYVTVMNILNGFNLFSFVFLCKRQEKVYHKRRFITEITDIWYTICVALYLLLLVMRNK